jgi:DNA-binding PadR family transcriptional regulator
MRRSSLKNAPKDDCKWGATLYTILGKFEKEKYIKEVQVEGRKRTYQITDKGRRAYEDELQRLRQCVMDAEGGNPYVR